MATSNLGRNITLEIYTAEGGSFHNLYLRKSTWDSIVMSLGDKITGDVYYPSNDLAVTMKEYVVYNGVHYTLVNPPVIVREGMLKDNAELSGMTKYSFTFYHPMYMLGNFPFTDVAVTSAQEKYLSQNKTFSWIGTLVDYVAKLNKNLQGTEWVVEIGDTVPQQERTKLSGVMAFDKQTIADALKKGYETWKVPYIIDSIPNTDSRYASGKRFSVRFGLPSQEILVDDGQGGQTPFVFQFGQGVGLKNNSRTPRNNKIVTRIAGYGSDTNVPYGYPQIPWTGDQSWDYTINNSSSAANSYPIYDGIMNGQRVRLIKHPFTRTVLMPSIYSETVNKKVNPNATGYDPTIEIKDYYDADSTYDNPINSVSPSYEIHEFDKIKPELGDTSISGAAALDGDAEKKYLTVADALGQITDLISETNIDVEKLVLRSIYENVSNGTSSSGHQEDNRYTFSYTVESDTYFTNVSLVSSNINFTMEIHRTSAFPSADWDDTMDDDGNYKQSYFSITLPALGFDIYACAAVTQEMKINMRSGACIGCSFPVAVDWEDYKLNFYDSDGNFAPTGSQRDYTKYPDSTSSSITVTCKKEIETFGTLMPNIYQQPASGDKFVILGISLPYTYVTAAEVRLDADMKQYMRDNNVYYYDYPLKFDEHFLATHTNVLTQMKPNIIVRFEYAGTTLALYIKQMTVKYGQSPLPQYDITLTDDVEIVLNQIGRVSEEVSNLRVLMGDGSGSVNLSMLDERYLSKINDDKASGIITFMRGLQIGSNFVSGLLGEGGVFRRDADGTTYLETDKLYVRMRAYFDTVEVKKYLHSGGNRIASKAGINCSRVEWLDSDGQITNILSNVVKFRCYFRATGDDGHEITNDFVVDDLAFCKETNVDTTSIDQHGYWRNVVAVSSTPTQDGEHWIDLSKTDCLADSDIPIAQDDIIQLGNKNDTTRQGAIIEYVGGDDAPAYQIYQGINSYSLNNKNYVRFGYDSESGGAQAFIGNPDQSTYLWYHNVTEGGVTFPRLDIKANVKFMSPTTHQETTIEDFAEAVENSIDDLQSQIDGEIDTWFYDGTPTLNNAPANEWDTTSKKERHLGDLYYDIGTGQTGGFAYRFIKTESGGTTTYSWQYIDDTAITEALSKAAAAYDLADHKRRVFLTTPTPPYDNGDLWVNAVWPASGASQGSIYNDDILRCLTSKTAEQQFAIADWTLASKYTDDSALIDFVTNTYAVDLANINTQIDKKAETWYQDTDPSTAWTTTDAKLEHVGDIWCDTSTNGGKKTWIWRDRGEGQSNRFYWAQQAVPDVVFDDIDGKAAVYTSWNAWVVDNVSKLNEKDLFIPSSDTTQGGVTYKANKVYRCTNASTPTFEEINYTDDSSLTSFLNGYSGTLTGIINDISTAQGTADDAAAVAAAAQYLKDAFLDNTGQAQTTDINGGLILSTIIGLRDANHKVWSGISGAYQASETGTGYKGHGIAAWYGGGMVDGEVLPSATNQAKSLFRFDGSGYVASKNISWDASGNVTIQGYSINATTLQMGGSNVVTEGALANYVTLATAQTITGVKTFGTSDGSYIVIGAIRIQYDSTNNALKIVGSDGTTAANFYATGGVSALGSGSGGSSGGGDVTWALLASSSDTRQIALSHLTGALGSYATQSYVGTYVSNELANCVQIIYMNGTSTQWSPTNGSLNLGNIVKQVKVNGTTYSPNANGVADLGTIGGGGSGTVTQVKVGTTAYDPVNGVVSLPAYPTSLPASDVYSWAKASTKPSYSLDEISDGSTRKLANYLPLSGGTLTNSLYISGGPSSSQPNSSDHARLVEVDHQGGIVLQLGKNNYSAAFDVIDKSWTKSFFSVGYGRDSVAGYGSLTAPVRQIKMGDLASFNGNIPFNISITHSGLWALCLGTNNGGLLFGWDASNLLGCIGAHGRPNEDTPIRIYSPIGIFKSPSYALDVNGNICGSAFIKSGATSLDILLGDGSTRKLTSSTQRFNAIPIVGDDGVMEIGKYIDFHSTTDSTNQDYATRITCSTGANTITLPSSSGTLALTSQIPDVSGYLAKSGGTMTGAIVFGGSGSSSSNSTGHCRVGRFDHGGGLVLQFGTTDTAIEIINKGWSGALFGFNTSGNFTASGAVTCLSDIRNKTIISQKEISVENIARMRSVSYRWNDGRNDKELHVGCIAQDWLQVLPEVVLRANDTQGTLSLQYGVAALVSSIAIARKVVNHEERIKQLEKENERLRMEIEQLRAA